MVKWVLIYIMKKLKLIIGVITFTFASIVSINQFAFGSVTCYWSYQYCDTGDCYDANDCPSYLCVSMEGESTSYSCEESSEQ